MSGLRFQVNLVFGVKGEGLRVRASERLIFFGFGFRVWCNFLHLEIDSLKI